MKLQRILAKDSRSANEQAIAKYGRDVLVVSNSRVNGMTELIVAVDVEPEKMPPPMMPRGGGEQFDAQLRQQRPMHEAAADASPSRGASESSPVTADGFVPAHMALMQAAQRAAAQSLGQSEPLRGHTPGAAGEHAQPREEWPTRPQDGGAMPRVGQSASPSATHAATHSATHATTHTASAPVPVHANTPASTMALRYGQQFSQQFSLPAGLAATTARMVLPAIRLNVNPAGPAHSNTSTAPSPAASDTNPSPDQSANSAADDSTGLPHQARSSHAADNTGAISSDKAQALTELVRNEIAQLRKEMRMGQQLQAWAAQGPSYRWNEALTEVGVPTVLRALLMSGLSNDFDDEQALAAIESQMVENLPRTRGRTGRGRNSPTLPWTSGVHLLSGPSGGGKTSMAARLAHEAAQRLGVERVVLVSWNDHRPGAWGQLQLWASRIGVAAFRAADSGTLDLLLQEHRGSLLIVDSGLSQPDILSAAVQGLNAHHHLVMPADANAATLRRWIGPQAPAWSDVLVTRLDESAQPWPLLQACCEHQLSPAIASDGSGLNHLRLPYDAQALLQHGMGVLSVTLGAPAGEHTGHGAPQVGTRLEIPTIDHITTTVPPRQAGRSGRGTAAKPAVKASAAAVATAPTRTRQGAPHA